MTDDPEASAFEALLAAPGDHVLLIVDDGLRILRASREAAVLADRREEDLLGMSLIAALGLASLDAVARSALAGARASGEASLGHLGARLFAVEAIPLATAGLVLSLHEITGLRRIERVRRDFVANISHELRTPLTSIKLLAETLSTGGVDDVATMRDFATQVEREVDHLAQLVDELLDLSMIESGEAQLEIAPTSADGIVTAVVIRIGPVAERRDVRIRARVAGDGDPRFHGDAGRLGQALLNLAHNAVKFSHRGGEVRIGWEERGERIRFTVADDGIGVPDAHKARVFERFYKVDRARTREHRSEDLGGSAGLGLSIVRHIAEAHGGSVGLDSEEGVGSTFWIEVPKGTR
jgi:two-component system phosphate regulon sensor histidine kinase PhoR